MLCFRVECPWRQSQNYVHPCDMPAAGAALFGSTEALTEACAPRSALFPLPIAFQGTGLVAALVIMLVVALVTVSRPSKRFCGGVSVLTCSIGLGVFCCPRLVRCLPHRRGLLSVQTSAESLARTAKRARRTATS